MPTASATSPMMPPRASTSRTRWPLATPPTAGLQLIWAMRSRFMVMSAVLRPMRAAAMAASQPAWPAPTTTTSYCSVKAIQFYFTDRRRKRRGSRNERAAGSIDDLIRAAFEFGWITEDWNGRARGRACRE